MAGVRGAPGLILLSRQAAGCGRGGQGSPGVLRLGRCSRARRKPPGASHEAFPLSAARRRRLRWQSAPTPEPELAASASQPQNRAESRKAFPFQLQPESRPARRGGVTGARGGVLGGVGRGGDKDGKKGVGSWAAATPPGRSGRTKCGALKQVSGLRCWLPPCQGTPSGPFLSFGSGIPFLSPSCRQTLLNLKVPCGLRGHTTPIFQHLVLGLQSEV